MAVSLVEVSALRLPKMPGGISHEAFKEDTGLLKQVFKSQRSWYVKCHLSRNVVLPFWIVMFWLHTASHQWAMIPRKLYETYILLRCALSFCGCMKFEFDQSVEQFTHTSWTFLCDNLHRLGVSWLYIILFAHITEKGSFLYADWCFGYHPNSSPFVLYTPGGMVWCESYFFC